jgi:hypothetical protein
VVVPAVEVAPVGALGEDAALGVVADPVIKAASDRVQVISFRQLWVRSGINAAIIQRGGETRIAPGYPFCTTEPQGKQKYPGQDYSGW